MASMAAAGGGPCKHTVVTVNGMVASSERVLPCFRDERVMCEKDRAIHPTNPTNGFSIIKRFPKKRFSENGFSEIVFQKQFSKTSFPKRSSASRSESVFS